MIRLRLKFCICFLFTNTAMFAQLPDTLSENAHARGERMHRMSIGFPYLPKGFNDIKTVCSSDWQRLYRIPAHPSFDRLLSVDKELEILKEINHRRAVIGKDTLLTADLLYIFRPYFDWLEFIDPHYRVDSRVAIDKEYYKNERELQKYLKTPGLNLLNINDTLIINSSIDPQVKCGDILLSVNDIGMSEVLKFNYGDRYAFPEPLLRNYYMHHISDLYKLRLVRAGKPIEVQVRGYTSSKVNTELNIMESIDKNIKLFEDSSCGYIAIPTFKQSYNKRTFQVVYHQIQQFKALGCKNIILDLRRNSGGSGYLIEKLLSIFIDRDSIPYIKNQKLKVSEEILDDYNFLHKNQIGTLVDMPESEFAKSIPLERNLHISGLNYFILMSKDTGSIAASFCNILQYSNAAKLVGEPLRHNALRYGETMDGRTLAPSIIKEEAISIIEIDECTKAVDGVLMPDIPIPYIAADYLSGKDSMVEKLLKIIATH